MFLRRRKSRYSKNLKSVPGTLEYVGNKEDSEITLELYDYESASFTKFSQKDIDVILQHLSTNSRKWLNVNDLHNSELITNSP